ncbi:MAG TPA: Do family serine endopeptidase [Myxococcales bacterium]|nr:Do family serine endopeptidase [Myxococcales bacterium]
MQRRSLLLACLAVLSLTASSGSAGAAAVPAGGLWHDQAAGSAIVPDIARSFPSLAPLVAQIKPAVVNIATTQHFRHPGYYGYGPGPFDQFFQQFFGGQMPQREIERQSLGSGFIIDEDGYVLTNNHVIEGADQIRVKLADGRELPAKVVGTDPKTDVALLKLEGDGKFPFLLLGDSDALQVGDWVLAIGNPFGLELSVTHGMVSAKERTIGAGPYDAFIQSDALINPGNSGGPLFSFSGAVVGINTAITRQGQGIGFAVPINTAKQLLPQLLSGHVIRGFLGAGLQPLTPDLAQSFGVSSTKGALVASITPGGPAARAGLRAGDVIVSFNGSPVRGVNELVREVAAVRPGTKVALAVIREGSPKGIKVRVGERPDDTGQAEGESGEQPGEQGGGEAQSRQDALGLTVRGVEGGGGVQVTGVAPETPAAEAGLMPGDVILEVNQKPVHSTGQYRAALGATRPGKMVTVRVQRQDEPIYFAMKMK